MTSHRAEAGMVSLHRLLVNRSIILSLINERVKRWLLLALIIIIYRTLTSTNRASSHIIRHHWRHTHAVTFEATRSDAMTTPIGKSLMHCGHAFSLRNCGRGRDSISGELGFAQNPHNHQRKRMVKSWQEEKPDWQHCNWEQFQACHSSWRLTSAFNVVINLLQCFPVRILPILPRYKQRTSSWYSMRFSVKRAAYNIS